VIHVPRLLEHLQALAMTAVSLRAPGPRAFAMAAAQRRLRQQVVYCCFDLERDLERACQVRDALTPLVGGVRGLFDPASWPPRGPWAGPVLDRVVAAELAASTTTLVLIGAVTASRRYVQRSIAAAVAGGHGICGLHVHSLHGRDGQPGHPGMSPYVPPACPFPTTTWAARRRDLVGLLDAARRPLIDSRWPAA
jgi:hypothetical protein